MKRMRRMLAAALMATIAVCGTAGVMTSAKAETSEPIPLDMYLIAGQSNAAGYSSKGIDDMTETFGNVGYGGEIQRQFRTGAPSAQSLLTAAEFRRSVTSGLGVNAGCIGPEYGMAKVLNDRYENEPDGRKAFIFKYAAGGTSLRDVDESDPASQTWQFGNWYPRSMWAEGYTPETENYSTSNLTTGVLYETFISDFKKVYSELKANGYAPQIKGLAWMQGENDLGLHTVYEPLLKALIADMREDLAIITGDENVYAMPFVIGKIATSFWEPNYAPVPEFNAMQQRVADETDNGVETVETSDLLIATKGSDGTTVGTDICHFNCSDARELGMRFARKIVEINERKVYAAKRTENGEIAFNPTSDGKIGITLIPRDSASTKYAVTELIVNGENVTGNVVGNKYVIDQPKDKNVVYAAFGQRSKYNVTYEFDDEFVGIITGKKIVYDGDDLVFTVGTKKGYKVGKVTVGDTEILPDADGAYTVTSVKNDVTIKIGYAEITERDDSGPEKKGCGKAAESVIPVAVALAASVFVMKKN